LFRFLRSKKALFLPFRQKTPVGDSGARKKKRGKRVIAGLGGNKEAKADRGGCQSKKEKLGVLISMERGRGGGEKGQNRIPLGGEKGRRGQKKGKKKGG